MNVFQKTLAGAAAAGTAVAGAFAMSGGQETKPAQQEPQTMPEMFAQLQRDDERRCRSRRIRIDECTEQVIYSDCSSRIIDLCEPDEQ